MAVAIDGIPVSRSIGKTTFARNRYGAYTRRRTKPVNPNSLRQSNQRAAFRSAVNRWVNGLTPLQRLGWETWAWETPWLNVAGESVRLSAQAAYIRQATFLEGISGIGSPPVTIADADTAPSLFALGNLDIQLAELVYDISDDEWTLTFVAPPASNSWNTAANDSLLAVRMFQPANPSRKFRTDRSRRVGWIAPNGTGASIDTVLSYTPGSPLANDQIPWALDIAGGQHVWLGFRAWNDVTRQISEEQIIGPVLTLAVP